MKSITAIMLFGALALASAAEARMFLPREGRFLSADRAGMIDGPNLYQYVRSNPALWRDPTGRFADVDPELPQLNSVLLATTLIGLDVTMWRLLGPKPCSIPDWETARRRLATTVNGGKIVIRASPSVWQLRWERSSSGAPVRLRRLALPAHAIGHTIFLTPGAGHTSITSLGTVKWALPDIKGIKTWVGLIAHELAHSSGVAGEADEMRANDVALHFESLHGPNVLPLSTVPYEAGREPAVNE